MGAGCSVQDFAHLKVAWANAYPFDKELLQVGKEGGREGGREEGRERVRKGGRKGGGGGFVRTCRLNSIE